MNAVKCNRARIPRMAALVATLLLSACAAPVFRQPDMVLPVAFKESPAAVLTAADGSRWQTASTTAAVPRGQWWRAFNDPALDRLIAEASDANPTLAVAAARLRQARAIARIADADRLPQIGVNAGAARGRSPDATLGLPAGTPVSASTIYQANLTASYEVDLFGRVSASTSAARSDAATAAANYQAVLLVLQADVAQAYFRLRSTDAELATLAQTVALRAEGVHVNQRRFELGDINEFDVARGRTELATTRAEAIGLQRQRTQTEHALALLLGRAAADFTRASDPLLDTVALPQIPAGIPSALLERRPDIVAAQQTMQAANARIGVARAAMFPALTLNGGAGSSAYTASDVFMWSSRSWLLGALMSVPLFDGGRNRANVTRSEAVLEESVGAYRQSVLAAFADVEDNLAGLRILSEQAAEIDTAMVSARRSADLARKLYAAGRSTYLELLDAERNLTSVERSAVQLRGNRAATTVALIRALGGGWDRETGKL